MTSAGTGFGALQNNTTGVVNTASGDSALLSNTTGFNNIAVGVGAGQNLTTGDSNICIGNFGVAGESDTIKIGTGQTRAFIAGVTGTPVSGATVLVSSSGQLGVAVSSRRAQDAATRESCGRHARRSAR